MGARGLVIVAGVALLVGATALPVWALSISQAYIFSDWSSPNNVTGSPFVLNGTAGFQLSLDGSGVATSATALSGPVPISVAEQLYYQSHTGTIDPYEVAPGALEARVNSEIEKVDDSGLVNESVDAALNIDFTRSSTVTLRTSTLNVAVPSLVLFEDAGLDPFALRYCYDAACTTSDLLFAGFISSTTSTLLASGSGFGTDDYAPGIDQAFWFIFDQPVTGGYFQIGESQNFGSGTERLEVDFVGVTTASARVPEPGTLLLLGSGLAGWGAWRHRVAALRKS